MKKITLVFMLCTYVSFLSSAQKLQLGVKGGLNFPSKDAFDIDKDGFSASGWHGGIYGLVKISKIGIQPEVLYSSTVFNVDNININPSNLVADTGLNYTYFTMPIMGKLYLVRGINIQAGPQFGFLTNSKLKKSNGTSVDNAKNLKDLDISIAVGAGIDLPFGLQVNARYLIGISDIRENSGNGASSIRTSTLQISLGYALLKLGK